MGIAPGMQVTTADAATAKIAHAAITLMAKPRIQSCSLDRAAPVNMF
jgi:hypothetical protein